MKYAKSFSVAGLLITMGASFAFAQQGGWKFRDDTNSPAPTGQASGPDMERVRMLKENLVRENQPLGSLIRSGFRVVSVFSNYVAGTTEIWLNNDKNDLINCRLKATESSNPENPNVYSICYKFE